MVLDSDNLTLPFYFTLKVSDKSCLTKVSKKQLINLIVVLTQLIQKNSNFRKLYIFELQKLLKLSYL